MGTKERFDVEKIRGEFPILGEKVYGKPLIYLDSGATAQKPQQVLERIDWLNRHLNANIHRGVHLLSEQATELYEEARRRIADFIGAAEKEEVVFTAGATASLNTVAYAWGDTFVGAGDNIVVSEMEHHSNLVPWQLVAQRRGAELRMLPIDDRGALRTDLLPTLIDERTRVVAVTQASNTLGTRPDLRPVIEAAHAVGAVAVVDGCQGVVHGGVDVRALDCDFYAFSGHKLYGPTGIGVLYGKRELLERMPPFFGGGDMVDRVTFARTTYAPVPLKFEAGTANFIGAIGLGEAIRFLSRFDAAEIEAHETMLRQRAEERLSAIPGLRIYGETADKCGIVSFNIEGAHHYDVGMILDKLGIAVRTGHHCAEPVMDHFGITGMCRVSLALYNTASEIDALVAGVERAVRMLRN
ncbi:cysteine desulfurase [Alistipes sp. An54]|uniref:SufS family cysteine desulfurase n=1 Tax=Alistipes sp. An54 TaxID=1965645 RepID=UPI000B388785|nr:SufS family cysteine desulfurase [Alistipes sp. An54]OUN78800.1 cysteine desulfurase [Alistipes sp. An54]